MNHPETRPLARLEESKAVEGPPGIFRTALSWNPQIMLCHFRMTRGAAVPLHDHPAVQSGFVVRGKIRFRKGDGGTFEAAAGTSYAFGPGEAHGADVLEDAEVIECFAPLRPEYIVS